MSRSVGRTQASLCPRKVERVLAGIERQSVAEGMDFLDMDSTEQVLAKCAVCTCIEGPQPTRLMGISLPKFLGQTCGDAIVSSRT